MANYIFRKCAKALIILIAFASSLQALELENWIHQIDSSAAAYQEESSIRANRHIELVFVYSSSCGFCKKFAPIFNHFVNQHQIKFTSITVDGGLIPGFENANFLPHVAKALEVTVYPTVLAINPVSKDVMTVSQGYVTLAEFNEAYSNTVKSLLTRGEQ